MMYAASTLAAYHLLLAAFLKPECIKQGIYTQQQDIIGQNATHEHNAFECQVCFCAWSRRLLTSMPMHNSTEALPVRARMRIFHVRFENARVSCQSFFCIIDSCERVQSWAAFLWWEQLFWVISIQFMLVPTFAIDISHRTHNLGAAPALSRIKSNKTNSSFHRWKQKTTLSLIRQNGHKCGWICKKNISTFIHNFGAPPPPAQICMMRLKPLPGTDIDN